MKPVRIPRRAPLRLFAAGLLIPSGAFAGASYEQARVVGVQPIYQTVSYAAPREQCS